MECKTLRSFTMHLQHNAFCEDNHNKASLSQFSRLIVDYNIFDENNSIRSNTIFEDEEIIFKFDSNFGYSLMDLKKYTSATYNVSTYTSKERSG